MNSVWRSTARLAEAYDTANANPTIAEMIIRTETKLRISPGAGATVVAAAPVATRSAQATTTTAAPTSEPTAAATPSGNSVPAQPTLFRARYVDPRGKPISTFAILASNQVGWRLTLTAPADQSEQLHSLPADPRFVQGHDPAVATVGFIVGAPS